MTASNPSRLPGNVRILLVSQMYPGPDDPDLGVFVANLERELAARGHELERAVVDRRAGGKLRHVGLALDARRAARRIRPDVVYAHFLAPAGLIGGLASRAPLVVTAHGGIDVLAVEERPAPDCGPAEVLVEVAAAGVNFIDVYQREGVYPTRPPFVGGNEGAGTVVAAGDDVEGFQPGDRVAWAQSLGSAARFAALITLARLGDETGAAGLLRWAEYEAPSERLKAVRAIAGTGRRRFEPELARLAWTERDALVQRELLSALESLVPPAQRPAGSDAPAHTDRLKAWASRWEAPAASSTMAAPDPGPDPAPAAGPEPEPLHVR